MGKAQLRLQMRRRRSALNQAQRLFFGEQFLTQIKRLDAYRGAANIGCYWPLWGELDTRPLMNHAHRHKKKVFLPVIDNQTMWFSHWNGSSLIKDRQSGIAQPLKASERLINANLLDVVIVPLLAFDRRGMRLGQGGGFYDRFFARQHGRHWHKPKLFGAAYDFQECARAPCDSWDVPLAGVVTNCEVIFNQNRTGGSL